MLTTEFELSFAGPIDFAASLEIFRRSGDDLIDRWDGAWLVRTVRYQGRALAYACRAAGTLEAPCLRVTVGRVSEREIVENTLQAAFLALTPEFEDLCRIDPVIGWLAVRHRGFRPVLQADLFGALVRCISAQQVNLKWASTVRRRLAESFGQRHTVAGQIVYSLHPHRIAQLTIADIRALQFTNSKAEYIINAARAVADGTLDVERLAQMSDIEVIEQITAVRGLGLWTAEWVLARTLGRPRVSAGDLGVRKAVGVAYFGRPMASPDEVRQATASWGRAAALAQGLLLHAQHEKTLALAIAAAREEPLTEQLGQPRRRRKAISAAAAK